MRTTGLALLAFLCAVSFLAAEQAEYSVNISDRLHISGEGGVAFFDTGPEGEFPESEFRVDEARLFFEAEILNNVYVFTEINIFQREDPEEGLEIGELYIEFEDVGNKNGLFNIRAGRFDIPFGEEYLTRDAIDNPLITHSLSDIWGVDEGIEIYGSIRKLEYVFAIQNGGEPFASDFNSDKAVVGRFLYNATPAVHFSVSAMRTGDLDVIGDDFSELWFGNGFLILLGSPTTTTFSGNLFQGDGHLKWERGHVHFAGGQLQYNDDDTLADNSKDVNYFQVEFVQNLTQSKENPWYAATRFSRITADRGFPMVGNGSISTFLFDSDQLTEELWHLSLGIGYRISRNLLLKAEYSFENGRQVSGAKRDQEDFFGIEVAVRF